MLLLGLRRCEVCVLPLDNVDLDNRTLSVTHIVQRVDRELRELPTRNRTGVPAVTWSALDLLTLGSGPGRRSEARAIGAAMQIDALGAAGVRANPELTRVVRAAVEGRTVRTGWKRAV